MSYKFQLEKFEGPLDLLLYLIRKNEINICDIPIVEITQQYMEYIEMMKLLDLDGIGDFLVMAATLLQIKSRMLLPPDPSEVQDEQDPRTDLVRRLEEYQRIKEAAEELRLRAEQQANLFPRRVDEEAMQTMREDAKEVYFEANLFDLITALTQAMAHKPEKGEYEVIKEEFTVEHKVSFIKNILLEKSSFKLDEIFMQARTKMEVVVTFMAVLELCRQKELVVVQKRLFSDIEIVRSSQDIIIQPQSQEL